MSRTCLLFNKTYQSVTGVFVPLSIQSFRDQRFLKIMPWKVRTNSILLRRKGSYVIYIYTYVYIYIYLVGGIPTPLKNMKVSWDDDIPNIWKN